MSTNTVEAVGWDISLGLCQTGIGKLYLWATSACENSVPDSIDHVGIKVFGYIYEYGDCGILKTKIPKDGTFPPSKYPTFNLRAVEAVGETNKTQEEFEEWIREQNREDFRGNRYDIVNHNCIVWATRATEFLGVSYPSNWDKMRKYADANKFLASIVAGSIMTSRQISMIEPLGIYE